MAQSPARLVAITILCVGSFILTSTVPALYIAATGVPRLTRRAIADATAAELARVNLEDRAATRAAVGRLVQRYDLAGIVVYAFPPSQSKDHEYRQLGRHVVEIAFVPRPGSSPKPLSLIMMVALVSTLASMILLALELSALARDRREKGDETATGTTYLRTFQSSLQTLTGHASEMQRLRDQEKQRADELAIVTATLIRGIASGFIATDERGAIVDINATARELLKVRADMPVNGRSMIDVLGDTAFARTVEGAIASRTPLQRHEVEEPGEDGAVFGLTTVPLIDAHERELGMLVLFTDLAPMRRLELRMRQMQSLADIGEMSAGIAHEFRNSLSTIVGYLRLAGLSTRPEETRERIERADLEARQLNAAVESLLTFARPMALRRTNVDLRELAADIVERLRPLAGETEIAVDGPPAVIKADGQLLGRALENVIRNAIEAVREKGAGRVRVETSATPAPSVIVIDDGVGFAEQDAQRLFLPFQSTKSQGFGLGLALARKIVLLHGGMIRLQPGAGGGATATLAFPPDWQSEESDDPGAVGLRAVLH